MYGLQPDMFLSLLRHILGMAGAFLVAKGWISADISGQLVGSLVSIIAVAFAGFFHASSNGSIQTLSTTSNASPNSVETRTLYVPRQEATKTEAAVAAHTESTVTTTS